MNRRLVSTLAGTIVIGSAIGIAVAQVKSVADANSPDIDLVAQEMTAGQMIDYLKEKQAPFIIETTDLPKDRKYEIHLNGASKEEAVQAVAEALNLKMKKKGNVWVLESPKRDAHFDFDFDFHHDGMGDHPNFQFFKEGQFEKFGEEMGKLFDDPTLWKELEGKEKKDWTPEQKAKFEEKMKKFEQEMKKLEGEFKFDFDFKEGDMKAFAERMQKLGEKARFEIDDEKMKVWREKAKSFELDSKKMEEEMRRLEKLFETEGSAAKIRLRDTDSLFASVTEAQWKLMKERGHLTIADLTPAQREMLGGLKGDTKGLNITITKDGKTIKIQGD